MIEISLARKILNILLKNGGDFSEIFIQKRIINSLHLEDSKLENASSGFELGCGLRLICGDSTYYAYIDSLAEEKLLNAARILGSAVNTSSEVKVLDLTERKLQERWIIKDPPSKKKQSEKKELLLKADISAREYNKQIIQVTGSLSDVENEEFIATSEGTYTQDSSVKVFLAVNVIAEKNGQIRTGYKSLGKTSGYEVFENISSSNIAVQAASISVKMLDAINAPAGAFPVVIGPAFGGVIFHEACGHGLEADAIIKDASVFKDSLNKKIASSKVTAIDNPSMPFHWGSYIADSEGYPSGENILIEKGILINYITDYKSAKKAGFKRSGNGRRQSYRDIPLPRMSNTYIAGGNDNPDDIVKSVDRGIYAKEFSGGQVDPATGDFVFGISEGYLIVNGKIAEPVKGATLIGNGPQILKKIEYVGNNLDFAPGFCGKSGQSIANEVGQPTILISSITVGGTSV
jgi:TldD protein